jgi:hypothetical protein
MIEITVWYEKCVETHCTMASTRLNGFGLCQTTVSTGGGVAWVVEVIWRSVSKRQLKSGEA